MNKLGSQHVRTRKSLQHDISITNNEIKRLEAKFDSLKKQMEAPKKNMVSQSNPKHHEEVKRKEDKEVIPDEPAPQHQWTMTKESSSAQEHGDILYLSSPDQEKTFFAPEATVTPNPNTIYEIVNNSELRLYDRISEQTMRLAMNSSELLIKRVCEVVNARENHHQKFEMVSSGKVTKENDDIVVVEKAKVKFV